MSGVRKFRPPNRLAKMINGRGGLLAKDAIEAAELGVETLRETCMAELDEALAEIERRFSRAGAREAETFDALYALTLRVIDMSAFVADTGLDKAAHSLAALADSCAEAQTWRWDAVDVHLNALRLLRSVGASLPEADRKSMLTGLYKVSHLKVEEA